jgi:uncharacterized membrane protein
VSRLARPTTAGGWAVAALWTLYLIMWIGGVGSYVILGGVRPGDEWTAPLFLTLAGLIVVSSVSGPRQAVLLMAGLLGFIVEWVGLRTGLLFGDYRYTDVLAPLVLGVPLVMISAWLVLVAYVDDLVTRIGWRGPLRIAGGALLLTAIDLIIDPLAAGPLDYWTWTNGGSYYGVPAHNFAGWFLAGGIILALVQLAPSRAGSASTLRAGLSIVLFFTIIAAAKALLLPALAGGAICIVHAMVSRSHNLRWTTERADGFTTRSLEASKTSKKIH